MFHEFSVPDFLDEPVEKLGFVRSILAGSVSRHPQELVSQGVQGNGARQIPLFNDVLHERQCVPEPSDQAEELLFQGWVLLQSLWKEILVVIRICTFLFTRR